MPINIAMDTRLPSLESIKKARQLTATIQKAYRKDRAKSNSAQTKRAQNKIKAIRPASFAQYRELHDKLRRERIKESRSGLELTSLEAADKRKVEILSAGTFICHYCGDHIANASDRTTDHIIAITNAGKHTVDNLVPACRSCNSRKNARAEFFC